MTIESFGGTLLSPGNGAYDTRRFGWNAMIDRRPAVIAECQSVEDVVAAVKYAAEQGLTAVARGGGHSVSGASLPENGVLVDLAGIKKIDVDPDARLARVGGGALLGELDAATQAHGLAVTAGVEPETGVGGLTLGGGIGFLARRFGLTIDNLVGVQVVLADGTVVEANESEHPELFWALRGGGGQFGIVTRFDLRLHPVGPEIVAAMGFYPLEKAHEVLRFVRGYLHGASDDVSVLPALMKIAAAEPFPVEWHGQPCVAVVGLHLGDECFEKLTAFSDGTVYLNYLDRDELGRMEKGFGPNHERLREVKAKYDPENRFGGVLGGAG